MRILDRNRVAFHHKCYRWVRNIDYLQSLSIGDEQESKLLNQRSWRLHGNRLHMSRLQRLVKVDNSDTIFNDDVRKVSTNRDITSACQNPTLIPGQSALQEVVTRFAIGKCVDVGQNQSFFRIGDQRIVIQRMECLFLVDDAHQVTLVTLRCDGLSSLQ